MTNILIRILVIQICSLFNYEISKVSLSIILNILEEHIFIYLRFFFPIRGLCGNANVGFSNGSPPFFSVNCWTDNYSRNFDTVELQLSERQSTGREKSLVNRKS